MPRIPASRIGDPRLPRSGGSAGRRVLKSHRLDSKAEGVVISHATFPLRTEDKAPAQVPLAEEGRAVAVRDAIAAAERNFDRRLEAASAKADREGYERGLAEGLAQSEADLTVLRERLGRAADGFRNAWDCFAPKTEPLLAELAFRLAEAILGAPLPPEVRRVSTTALSEALERLGETASAQVTLNPVDFMALTEAGIVAQLGQNHPGVRWHTDASLERGDWEARSDTAVVRRVALEMLADARERLSSLDPDNGVVQ